MAGQRRGDLKQRLVITASTVPAAGSGLRSTRDTWFRFWTTHSLPGFEANPLGAGDVTPATVALALQAEGRICVTWIRSPPRVTR